MRIARALRILGYVLLVIMALPEAMDKDVLSWHGIARWLVAYALFGIAFHVSASAPENARRRRLIALVAMMPPLLAMALIIPCHFGSLSLIIVASQVALVLSPRITGVWMVVQSLCVGFCLMRAETFADAVAEVIALGGFQAFAAVAVYLARREAEAKQDLAQTNAELLATRALLEETSRVNERTRIARELHDVLGHDLTALRLQLEVATHVGDGKAPTHVAKAQEVSERLLANVRDVVTAMRATPPPDLGAALRVLADGAPGLRVHLDVPQPFELEDPARAHCVLRCVQEIVTNALRHARAQNLWIKIACEQDGAISVDAKDDGCGATVVRTGGGLSGMRARLEEMGGFLSVASAPSFAVCARLPAARGVVT
ncbi:MAG TPA: histidine kinase [Polyangiaceae bacterium]